MQSVNNYVSRMRSVQLNWLAVVSSGLTFLYFVELGLGIRTIARADSERYKDGQIDEEISSVKFFVCLALVTTTTGFTNLVSLNWEYKRKRSAASCYVFHLFQLGIVWRRGALSKGEEWELDSQLLATTKFVHSYFHTVPLACLQLCDIMHGESRESLAIVAIELFSVVVSTIVCCWIYGISNKEGRPGITDDQSCGATFLVPVAVSSSGESDKPRERAIKETKDMFCRYLMSAQMYCFLFGKLITIASLFIVFGMYSLLAIALQFFLNIIYLKYQMAYLVPETTAGHKKWARFFYLSYLLLFDWHFNRDPNTAFNLCSETKAGIMYYIFSIAEVIFVTVVSFSNGHSSGTLNLLVISTVLVITSVFSQILLLLYFRVLTGTDESSLSNLCSIQLPWNKQFSSLFRCSRKSSAPAPTISTIDGYLAENEGQVNAGSTFTNSYLDFKDLEDSVPCRLKSDGFSSSDHKSSLSLHTINQAEKPFETFQPNSGIFSCSHEERVLVHNPSTFEALHLSAAPSMQKSSLDEKLLWDEVTRSDVFLHEASPVHTEPCFNRNVSMSWPSRCSNVTNFKQVNKGIHRNSFCNSRQRVEENTDLSNSMTVNADVFGNLTYHPVSEKRHKERSAEVNCLEGLENYM